MILVDVYVPSVDDKFDFTIDENTLVRKVIEELSGIISKKMKNSNVNQRIEFDLYDIKRKNHIDKEAFENLLPIYQYFVKNKWDKFFDRKE